MVSDAQVRKLLRELAKIGKIEQAAMKANMHRNTARKYIKSGRMPSEAKKERNYRTRDDPFADHWPEIAEHLFDASELEAKALFEHLMEKYPGRYSEGQLRTFQRRVREWRAKNGPDKEVFFPQNHRPGEAMQLDFTSANQLGITIQGEPFPHMLCHTVLPYSNWEHATTCQSESMLAIRRGLQSAIFKLGYVSRYLQTDHSTAATHLIGQDAKEEHLTTGSKGKRGYNQAYYELVTHFGMKPRTTGIGRKEQNGDVEALHGVLKRRLKQQLLLRGSQDFKSWKAYEMWLDGIVDKANATRTAKIAQELGHMLPLRARILPEYREETARVLSWSTISVMRNTYSVPSRLIGEKVKVRIFEERLEVYYRGEHQLTTERLTGRRQSRIDYRHIIRSLVRKPGAFSRYRFRSEMFPSLVFRRVYDALLERFRTDRADLEYLRILKLAAQTMESEVEAALELLMGSMQKFDSADVWDLVVDQKPQVPEMPAFEVHLKEYDGLLQNWAQVTS